MNVYRAILRISFAALFLLPLAALAANPYDGRLVKSESSSAVYYVGIDNKRHAFPNQKIYFSWFPNFAKVEIISDFELSLYPLGENVLYRPGSRLIKIPDVPEVYAVEPGGRLRNIVSEQAAIALFGTNWSKKVDDIDISFFFDYEIDGVIDVVNEKAVFPRGTLVNFDGSNYVVDKRTDGIFTLRAVTASAWQENRFDLLERQTLADPALREFFEIGLPVTTAEPSYNCPSCPASLFFRDSVALTSLAVSDNGKYRLQLPLGWSAGFPADGGLIVTQSQQFEEGGLERSFRVYRVPAADYEESLQVFIDDGLYTHLSSATVYEGSGLFLNEGYDVVIRADAVLPQTEDTIEWNHYLARGDSFYRLQFTVPAHRLSASVDLIEIMLSSYRIDPTILD